MSLALSMKLTGLTPTEFAREEVARWNRNVALANAYHDGARSVRDNERARHLTEKMIANGEI